MAGFNPMGIPLGNIGAMTGADFSPYMEMVRTRMAQAQAERDRADEQRRFEAEQQMRAAQMGAERESQKAQLGLSQARLGLEKADLSERARQSDADRALQQERAQMAQEGDKAQLGLSQAQLALEREKMAQRGEESRAERAIEEARLAQAAEAEAQRMRMENERLGLAQREFEEDRAARKDVLTREQEARKAETTAKTQGQTFEQWVDNGMPGVEAWRERGAEWPVEYRADMEEIERTGDPALLLSQLAARIARMETQEVQVPRMADDVTPEMRMFIVQDAKRQHAIALEQLHNRRDFLERELAAMFRQYRTSTKG